MGALSSIPIMCFFACTKRRQLASEGFQAPDVKLSWIGLAGFGLVYTPAYWLVRHQAFTVTVGLDVVLVLFLLLRGVSGSPHEIVLPPVRYRARKSR